MNLYWKNIAPYTHRVKPPKAEPRYTHGFRHFLVRKKIAIENYLALEEIWEAKMCGYLDIEEGKNCGKDE